MLVQLFDLMFEVCIKSHNKCINIAFFLKNVHEHKVYIILYIGERKTMPRFYIIFKAKGTTSMTW
jgi:hypothetical protein